MLEANAGRNVTSDIGVGGVDVMSLLSDQSDALSRIESRTNSDTALTDRMKEVQSQIDEVTTIKDAQQREIRLKVLNATFDRIREDLQKEAEDTALAVYGLNTMTEKIDSEISNLTKTSPEDEANIAKIRKRIEVSQATIKAAEAEIGVARGKFFFRRAATKAAEAGLADAQVQEKRLLSDLKEAESQAKVNARQRLMNASLEESLQQIALRIERTAKVMTERKKTLEAALATVTAQKSKAIETYQQAAKVLEELERELTKREADLQQAEMELAGLLHGSPEYSQKFKEVSDLKAETEIVRGKRNTALLVSQSKEKFSNLHELYQQTHIRLLSNQRSWIAVLISDNQERMISFRSRLEAQKALADQEVAKTADKIGAESDQRGAEFMASAGEVSSAALIDMAKRQPERIRKIHAVLKANAESSANAREEFARFVNIFREKYGIDPEGGSIFDYDKPMERTAPEPKAQDAVSDPSLGSFDLNKLMA